jgi:hypothetical protein
MATSKSNAVSPSNTGTGAGSASNTVTPAVPPPPASSTGAVAVAPKGLRLQLQQMMQGWQAVIPAGSTMPSVTAGSSAGVSLSQPAVVAQLQSYLGDYTSQDAAALAMTNVRAQLAKDKPAAKSYLAELKAALSAFFGASSPQLAQFGLKPKKAAKKLTAQELAASTAKAAATRKLRSPLSKAAKAKLSAGPVTVSVESAVQPAAPAETPAAVAPASPTASSGK